MAQVVDERVATGRGVRAGSRVAADVAVDLLRPVAHVGAHVRPERRVLQPLLHASLVGADLADALADADDEDDALRRRAFAARVVEPAQELADLGPLRAVSAPDRRGELVHRPGVARLHVEARGNHAAPRLDPGLVPRRAGLRHPLLPAREVDLGECMELRPERADLHRLAGTRARLLPDDGRHGDVVLRAGRGVRGEPRREAHPVGRGVEDGAQRPAVSCDPIRPEDLPVTELLEELGGRSRLERRHRLTRPQPRPDPEA